MVYLTGSWSDLIPGETLLCNILVKCRLLSQILLVTTGSKQSLKCPKQYLTKYEMSAQYVPKNEKNAQYFPKNEMSAQYFPKNEKIAQYFP